MIPGNNVVILETFISHMMPDFAGNINARAAIFLLRSLDHVIMERKMHYATQGCILPQIQNL
jgi:hypothetical protein